VQDGAEYVETDIRRSADGHLVLLHDATLERTTTGNGPVSDATLAELDEIDAGSWFAARFAGQRVPRFPDFLRWIEERPPFGAALEVKAVGVGAEVARAAWQSPARERLAIYSFLPDEIRDAKAAEPGVPCVLLLRLSDDPDAVLGRIEACGADGADVPWEWDARALLAGMRERGLIIGGGSASGGQAADVLVETGVDMIDTDDPAAMLAAVGTINGQRAQKRAG
jgi:glycerophosphoryl diester phosphodiesterase